MKLTIGQIQFHIVDGDVHDNLATALRLIDEMCERTPIDIVTLPELWSTGFAGRERIAREIDSTAEILRILAERAAHHRTNIVCGTLPEAEGKKMFNTCFLIDREGRLRGSFRKNKLFPGLNECETFEPGGPSDAIQLDETKIGAMVCFDIRYPEIARALTYKGAEILFVSAQFPYSRLEHWRTLLKARAIENQLFVVATNGVGNSGGVELCGHSAIFDPWGATLTEMDEAPGFAITAIDTDIVRQTREKLPCLEFPPRA